MSGSQQRSAPVPNTTTVPRAAATRGADGGDVRRDRGRRRCGQRRGSRRADRRRRARAPPRGRCPPPAEGVGRVDPGSGARAAAGGRALRGAAPCCTRRPPRRAASGHGRPRHRAAQFAPTASQPVPPRRRCRARRSRAGGRSSRLSWQVQSAARAAPRRTRGDPRHPREPDGLDDGAEHRRQLGLDHPDARARSIRSATVSIGVNGGPERGGRR